MTKVSMSHEEYLEAIVMLGGTTEQPVRSVDVANKLGVSKASVSKAISSLREAGMLNQPYYGDITLTESGFEYGSALLKREQMLERFLVEKIGLSEEEAEKEACHIEHCISDEAFEKWLAFLKKVGIE
ncbi:MAG: metal-dependent transcriptional regulator [Coriobacteriia bacterium]|nr:metal-dependent transcriptional regulator [Coriobacteriia bacterium]